MNIASTKKFSTFEISMKNIECDVTPSNIIQSQFEIIYSNFPYEFVANLSKNDRKALNANNDRNEKISSSISLTYGEVNDILPIWEIFSFIRKCNNSNSKNKIFKKFYDLGSGVAKPVIAAALCAPLVGIEICVGIEILKSLHEVSLQVKEVYLLKTKSKVIIDFYLGSFLDSSVIDWSDGDIIFANSTCYDKNMMRQLYIEGLKLKSGSYFITLSNSLPDNDDIFDLVKEERYAMSWGMADFFIYCKR